MFGGSGVVKQSRVRVLVLLEEMSGIKRSRCRKSEKQLCAT